MDDASPTLLFHVWDDFSGEPDCAEKVLIQGGHDGFVVEFGGASWWAVTHVSDQDADLAEPVEGVAHHAPDVPCDRKVGRDGQDMLLGTYAGQFDLRVAKVGLCPGADRHVGPFLGECQGDSPAHAPAGASDDGNPVFKSQVHDRSTSRV